MPQKTEFSRSFFSLVNTSFLTGIATIVCAFPSQAASIAFSQISTELNTFSHQPYTTQTLTNTTTLAIALTESLSFSIAQAEASFFVEPTLTTSEILSSAGGEGSNYFSSAQSEAQIIGDFTIDAGELFSFDFTASINSLALIDDLSANESADTSGELSFLLVDTLDQNIVYDSFLLSFGANIPSSSNSLSLQTGDNFSLENTTLSNSSNPTQNISSALIQGSFSYQFENSTNITLIQEKNSRGSVAVPEPNALLGSLFFLALIGIKYKTRKNIASSQTCYK